MARMKPAQYARWRSCSRQAVSRAIQDGRVTLGADGLLDRDLADIEWERRTHREQQRRSLLQPGALARARANGSAAAATWAVLTRADLLQLLAQLRGMSEAELDRVLLPVALWDALTDLVGGLPGNGLGGK